MRLKFQQAFTLIEVMITIAISSIVIGIIFGLVGPLNRGIRQDQLDDGHYAVFQSDISILERVLRNGKVLVEYESNDSFGEMQWRDASGELQVFKWDQTSLWHNDRELFRQMDLDFFNMECQPLDYCIEGAVAPMLFKLNFKYEELNREVSVRWRP